MSPIPVPESLPASSAPRSLPIFLVICTAVFMTNLDLRVVNVALDAIGRDLAGQSLSGLSWVINGYTVALAALLIVAGRLGDRSGLRRLFLIGTVIFTIASLGCALAPNLGILVAVRVLQATGAAILLPASLSLLLHGVPAERRHTAARIWSAVGALAAASGPALGGLLIEASWRWVFVINVPIGIAVVFFGFRILADDVAQRDASPRQPLPDVIGSGLLAAGVAALTGAIVQGPDWGWTSGRVIGLAALALVALIWFFQRCATQPVPLIELNLWRIRAFAIANVGSFLFSISFAIMLLSNSLWCQGIWGYSALMTGLAMAPGPAVVPFVAIASNRAIGRYGAGIVIAIGSLLFAAAQIWRVTQASASGSYAWDLLPSLILSGIGTGLAFSTMIASGSTALPANRSATGAAVLNTGRQIASAIGVAILVAALGNSALGPQSVHAFHVAWGISAVLVAAAAVVTFFLPRDRVASDAPERSPVLATAE
ncbi:MAG TPA: MFS transporter [Thermomicrobiales bacterium]|nr:MFS transporter [Thermomicrobiales bacterium]